MNAKELMSHLNAVGISISCEDSQLVIAPADRLTEETKQAIRENKSAILAEINNGFSSMVSNTGYLQAPYKSLTSPSETQSNSKYSMTVTDASIDPVLVEVTILGLASFTMEIPHAYYDGLALVEVLDQHSAEKQTSF